MITIGDTRGIKDLANRDIKLALIPGSPIQKIVDLFSMGQYDSEEALVAAIAASADAEALFSLLSSELATTMKSQCSFIRNNMLADIQDLYQAFVERQSKQIIPPFQYNAVARLVPELMTGEMMSSFIEENSARDALDYKTNFSALSSDELIAALQSFVGPDQKEALDFFIGSLPCPLEVIYDLCFRGKRAPNYPSPALRTGPSWVPFIGLEAAAAVLMAYALEDNEVVGNFPIPMDEFQRTIIGVRIQYATALKLRPELLVDPTRALTNNQKTYPAILDKYTTNGQTNYIFYADVLAGLQEQYSAELIVGLMAGKDTSRFRVGIYNGQWAILNTGEPINEPMVEALITAGTQVLNHYKMRIETTRQQNLTLYLRLAFEQEANAGNLELPEGMTVPQAMTAVNQLINTLGPFKDEEAMDRIRLIYTMGIWPNSGARDYLALIDSFADITTDAREGATLAAVEMYARYMANQVVTS